MSQFLQTGKMLYVLAAVCAFGIISKLMTGSLYKRMIKETGNMAFTKNKNLKGFRQRLENALLVSPGIRNTSAYIEKQLYGFRFWRISLDGWDNLSVQAMILSFLAGSAAAFGAYWYRLDMYYIVLYGAAGIFSGLLLAFVDNGVGIAVKRQQLSDCLADYMENSPHFYKNAGKSPENGGVLMVQPRARDMKKSGGAVTETASGKEPEFFSGEDGGSECREEREPVSARNLREASGAREKRMSVEYGASGKPEAGEEGRGERGDRPCGRFSVLSGRREGNGRSDEMPGLPEETVTAQSDTETEGAELAKSIEQLRKSLEQIAAAREIGVTPREEKPKERGTKGKKELRAEDLRVIGELLQEYLT